MSGTTDRGPGRTVRQWAPRILIWSAVVLCAWFLWPSRFGGDATVVVVQGNSMVPTYASGDLVVARGQDHYRPGDIVVFRVELPGGGHREALIVHRLIAIGPDGHVTTQGDNRDVADGFALTTASIVGRAVLRVPSGGVILLVLSRWWILGLIAGAITVAYLWPDATVDAESTDAESTDAESTDTESTDESEDRLVTAAAAADPGL